MKFNGLNVILIVGLSLVCVAFGSYQVARIVKIADDLMVMRNELAASVSSPAGVGQADTKILMGLLDAYETVSKDYSSETGMSVQARGLLVRSLLTFPWLIIGIYMMRYRYYGKDL